jgi:CheY-like chemotaxis protein
LALFLEEANDGRLAWSLLKQTSFDLIISDWNMPKMSGLELLKKVKEDELFKNIPFLMVTSEADKEKEAFQSGADQYITKPFTGDILAKIVAQLLAKPVVFEEKKVLTVDDSASMRSILVKNLNQPGFEENNIYQAEIGDDAIALMSASKIDLVLTDWHMPVMTELEFMKKVKAQKDFQHIPFLMVTGEINKKKIVQAIKEGANEYIIKPFNALELQEKIKNAFSIASQNGQ